jgi:hypothetical protein
VGVETAPVEVEVVDTSTEAEADVDDTDDEEEVVIRFDELTVIVIKLTCTQ